MSTTINLSEGQRITVRGEDFMVTRVKPGDNGHHIVYAKGLSELVKEQQFIFDTEIDTDIAIVDPKKMHFVPDTFQGYGFSKLYIENAMRCYPAWSDKITIATKGAFNTADYQLTPTIKALQLPRPRILIADGVGLGKTIEVGILLSELIKRSKGKRILIVALKSILAQFQEEMWNRFAIPVVRLDSIGVDRIRAKIPANKNPFEYYDKTIISIDTLKHNGMFRHYIEKTHWDIVVIDECHIVSNDASQRGDLAQLLAQKCESLILTSATPHNGVNSAFANLITMLEPTAIPSSGEYTSENIRDYYVRRFKKDITDEAVKQHFKEVEIIPEEVQMNDLEEQYLAIQQSYKAQKKKTQGLEGPDVLYSVSLFKAFTSSPNAAMDTLQKRINDILESGNTLDPEMEEMRDILQEIIDTGRDSKYEKFREILKRLKWTGKASSERFVVFSERISTIRMLKDRITKDFNIKDEEAICCFDGTLSDTAQEEIIEDFSKEDSKIRLLICSDAGSQGVNLHYYCNRMFNYDIPWSYITLEQRNGRIDRYGQERTPYIHYLIERSSIPEVQDDFRIINKLTEKEEIIRKTLGDVGSLTGMFNPKKEEDSIAKAIAAGDEDADIFDIEKMMASFNFDECTPAVEQTDMVEQSVSIFDREIEFYKGLFDFLRSKGELRADDYQFEPADDYLMIRNTPMLSKVLYDVPEEAKPRTNDYFKLTLNKDFVQKAIADSRKTDKARGQKWAEFQILYDLHPAVMYYLSCLDSSMDKDKAIAAKLNTLPEGSAWYVFHGTVNNGRGQQIISEFFTVPMRCDGTLLEKPMPLKDFIAGYLKKTLSTAEMTEGEMAKLQEILDPAVDCAVSEYMEDVQISRAAVMEEKKNDNLRKLEQWKIESQHGQLELFGEGTKMYNKKMEEITTIHDKSSKYISDMNTLLGDPFIRPLAVFYNF